MTTAFLPTPILPLLSLLFSPFLSQILLFTHIPSSLSSGIAGYRGLVCRAACLFFLPCPVNTMEAQKVYNRQHWNCSVSQQWTILKHPSKRMSTMYQSNFFITWAGYSVKFEIFFTIFLAWLSCQILQFLKLKGSSGRSKFLSSAPWIHSNKKVNF